MLKKTNASQTRPYTISRPRNLFFPYLPANSCYHMFRILSFFLWSHIFFSQASLLCMKWSKMLLLFYHRMMIAKVIYDRHRYDVVKLVTRLRLSGAPTSCRHCYSHVAIYFIYTYVHMQIWCVNYRYGVTLISHHK